MASEGLPVEVAARVLDVSVSGYYAWLTRPPSARSIRHALLTEAIRAVHTASNGIYGVRRVHAELTLGRGLTVGHGAVELLMQRAGLRGVTGRPKWVRIKPDTIAKDLVNRTSASVSGGAASTEELVEALTAGTGMCLVAEGNLEAFRHEGIAAVRVTGLAPSELVLAWRRGDDRPVLRALVEATTRAVGDAPAAG